MNSLFGQVEQSFKAVWVSNSGVVAGAGVDFNKLGPEQIAIFPVSKSTTGVIPKSIAAPSFNTYKRVVLKQGLYPFSGQATPFLSRQTKHARTSIEFEASDVVSFTGIKAEKTSRTEIVAIGYDGLDATKTLGDKLDTKPLHVNIILSGEPIKRFFSTNRVVHRVVIDKGFCGSDCECLDTCGRVPADLIADKLIEHINTTDLFTKVGGKLAQVPLRQFIKANKIKKCEDDPTAPTLVEYVKFSLSVCETAGATLPFLYDAYPNVDIKLESRADSISTYSFWQPALSAAPAAFTKPVAISLAECGTCPAGYTTSYASNVTVVTRPLAGTETLITSGNKQTYADTVKAAYFAPKVFNGATAVDPATNQITITAHGLSVNQPVVYSNGGGTTIVGMTNGATYYIKTVVDANNVTLSSTPGGTVIDITADGVGASHSLTFAATATFLTTDGATAEIQFVYDATIPNVTALAADSVEQLADIAASCTPPANASIAWTEGESEFTTTKSFMISLSDVDCTTGSRLSELQAAYPELTIADLATGTCRHAYTTSIESERVKPEDCGKLVTYEFTAPASFMGVQWVEGSAVATDPDCDTPTPEVAPCCVAGVILETAVWDKHYTDCTYGWFEWHPNDAKPVRLQVNIHSLDYSNNPCDETHYYSTVLQQPSFALGAKGEVVQEYERNFLMYEDKFWTPNPFANEVSGFILTAKPHVYYDQYVLRLKRKQYGTTYVADNQNTIDYIFFIEEGRGKELEALLNPLVTSAGLSPVIL